MSESAPTPAGERKDGARPDASGLASEAASLLDSLLEYLGARVRLEGYRLEVRSRALVREALALAAAGAVALFGLALLSFGAALVISERLGSRPAGFLIVGAFYLVAASAVAAALTARRRP